MPLAILNTSSEGYIFYIKKPLVVSVWDLNKVISDLEEACVACSLICILPRQTSRSKKYCDHACVLVVAFSTSVALLPESHL